MKGEFLDAWNYDAYGQYYYVTFNQQSNNYFSYAAIDNALLATNSPTGPVCLSGKPCAMEYLLRRWGDPAAAQLSVSTPNCLRQQHPPHHPCRRDGRSR